MEHLDYKFLFKVFTFLFKNRKILTLKPVGKALGRFFTHPDVEKCIPYTGAFYKYFLTPTMFGSYVAMGFCVAVMYLYKTSNVLGAIGILLIYIAIALIQARFMLKATSKIKIKITITGSV